jgi:hypothetical protein
MDAVPMDAAPTPVDVVASDPRLDRFRGIRDRELRGAAVDPGSGSLLLADSGAAAVRVLSPGGVVGTLAGLGFWRLLRRRGRRHSALLLLTAE